MSPHILVGRAGRVLTVTISRAEKKNALTQEMYGALADAIESYGEDDSARALVLTGAADAFSAGNDLGDFAAPEQGSGEPPVGRFLRVIKDCPKPLIAAVNGLAVGVGLTMLLHCDLVYASERATFSAPFVGLGLV
ncbi:MAG: enoyl-CoA hydratase-related protein, partial [Myxococcota bacterium]